MRTNSVFRLLGIALFLITTSLQARPDAGESVVFNAAWLKNEAQSYTLEYLHYSLSGKDTTELEKLSLQIEVLVQDSSSDYFVLEWHFHDFALQSNHYPSVWLMQHIQNLSLSCKTSPVGVLKEFKQLEDFRLSLDKAVDLAFASYQGLPSESSRARVYSLREELEALLIRVVYHMHQAYGLGYVLDEVIEVPDKMEVRFSDSPVDAIIRKKLDTYDPESGIAGLVMATMLDSAQLNQVMQQYMSSQDLQQPVYRQQNTSALVMHIPSGWVLYSFDKREVSKGKDLYAEFFEISHLAP